MPLNDTCKDCNKPYSFLVLQKAAQTGRCPACQHTHDITEMNNELATLNRRIDRILPGLKELNAAKKAAHKAYDEAMQAWEKTARLHATLDRKAAIIAHERDLLIGAKKLATKKTQKSSLTPEQKARRALNGLRPEIRAAIIQQLSQEET